MKSIMSRLTKSPFVKNVAIMASGTAGAQAISIALSPIITRLYGPNTYGVMGTFTAITSVIIPIVALTYPIAIVLPKSDKNAKGLINLSLRITLMIAVSALILLLFLKNSIVSIFQIQDIAPFLYLIPFLILFAGIMQVTEQWLIRTNQFSVNAKASFMQSALTNGSKAGIGFVYPSAVVLVILQTLGNATKASLMIFFAKKSGYTEKGQGEERTLTIKEIAKKHSDFPLYRAPEEFLSSFSKNLPVLLLTSFVGPAAAGFYNIGRTVLSLPSTLIGKAIGDVFYPRIAQAANSGENLSRLMIKASSALGVIGIIPFGTVIAFGPFLFEFVFGAGWDTAGEYARWIALSSISNFINKPIVKAMPILAAQRFLLISTICKSILRSASLVLGLVLLKSDIVAVALFGITSAISNLTIMLITIYISKRQQREIE